MAHLHEKTSVISQPHVAFLTFLGHHGLLDTNRNDSICVAPPKVAKTSLVVTVRCRCRLHYHAKTLPMEQHALKNVNNC